MYDPTDMMAVFAIFVALAAIVYLLQLFTSTESSTSPKLPSDWLICDDPIAGTRFDDWIYLQPIHGSVRDPIDIRILMAFPDVYIAPAAHKYLVTTRNLPEGAIALKRVNGQAPVSTLELTDRIRSACSVVSDINRANFAVKDGLQFGPDRRWRFFRLNHADLDDS